MSNNVELFLWNLTNIQYNKKKAKKTANSAISTTEPRFGDSSPWKILEYLQIIYIGRNYTYTAVNVAYQSKTRGRLQVQRSA